MIDRAPAFLRFSKPVMRKGMKQKDHAHSNVQQQSGRWTQRARCP
jgi:hypothetical protein